MEAEVTSEISAASLKKGRPKKVTGGVKAKTKMSERFVVVANLSEQNYKYLSFTQDATNHSFARLVNMAVEHCRKNDIFSDLEVREPAYITKAREALSNWEGAKRPTSKRARGNRPS